jgi:uncharacterized protein
VLINLIEAREVPSMLFAIIGHDAPNAAELRPKLRDAHLKHVRQLIEKGQLIMGGPFTDGSGMLIICDMENEAAVKSFVENDPFYVNKVLDRVEIKPYRKVLPD